MLEIWGLFVDVRCSGGDYSTICLKFEDFLLMFVAGGDLDHNDGQFFRAMEWLMFFFRPPLPSMVFQWF